MFQINVTRKQLFLLINTKIKSERDEAKTKYKKNSVKEIKKGKLQTIVLVDVFVSQNVYKKKCGKKIR